MTNNSFNFRKTMLVAIRAALITLVASAVILFFSVVFSPAEDKVTLAGIWSYVDLHLWSYINGMLIAALTAVVITFLYHIQWTHISDMMAFMNGTTFLTILVGVLSAVFIGLELNHTTHVLPFEVEYLAIALAFLYGTFGRASMFLYSVFTVGMIGFCSGDWVDLIVGAIFIMAPAAVGYVMNRLYWLIFVKKWKFEEQSA